MTFESEPEALSSLLEFVRRQRGVDFNAYKESSLQRRLEHRMATIGARSYSDYLDHIQATPEELNALLDTLFINVTRFFRDKPAWDALAATVIPALLGANPSGPIRVWCAGVASGEEAFTAAILLAEALGVEQFKERVKIFATDADDGALAQARAADYSEKQIADVPEELRHYFEENSGRYAFRSDLRRCVIFGRHNLLDDAPISRLDMLICRNTLMYFNREAQGRILNRFHFALKDDCVLFLGKAETMLTRRQLFMPLDHKLRIFVKASHAIPFLQSSAVVGRAGHEYPTGVSRIRYSAFDTSPIAHLLVNSAGELAFANEIARSTFGIQETDIGRRFSDLEVSFRPLDVRTLMHRMRSEPGILRIPAVQWTGHDSRAFFDITVAPLEDGTPDAGAFALSFLDVTSAHELKAELEISKGELETAYEELQSTNEELETTNEELQSTVEELETTNEELQSTNEELETMNEELQSTNDEIRHINDQLGERGDEVIRVSAYLRSVLDGQQTALAVLDNEMSVSMWNREAREMWGLLEAEACRQPFMNLDIGLPVHVLRDAIRRVLRAETGNESAVLQSHDRKGRPFECRVTMAALRSDSGDINGVIVTMEDAQHAPRPGPAPSQP